MGKYKHKNGKVGSGVALNMIKANSSAPFELGGQKGVGKDHMDQPIMQGDGSKLKKKINKLSDKHKGLYNAVVEGYGQNEYTSGNYDKDYKKLGKVEDRLKRKEKRYEEKFGKSPYGLSMKGPLEKGCAKSEGGPGCVQKKGNEYVIINNKKPGNQVWRGGFASKAEANKVLAGYHASK